MSGTIAGTVQTEIVLNTASSYLSPLTITGAVIDQPDIAAIDALQQWIIVNEGSITANSGDGIMLNAGGTAQNSGFIDGAQYGIYSTGKGLANLGITNSGIIESGGTGVLITNGNDTLGNLAGGLISGGTLGVRFTGFSPSQNTLANAGTIESQSGMAIALAEAAGVNAAGGVIESGATALSLGVLTSFVNLGTISGQTGVFSGSASATIVNAGTIIGQIGDAVSFTSSGGTLALLPGEVMQGIANGGNAGELLLTGNGAGTLAGFGTQVINFGTVEVAPGATWEFSGATTIAATTTLENLGTIIDTQADTLGVFGTIAGAGLIDVENATLALHNSVAAGETILLDGPQSTLDLTTPNLFSGTIAGFGGSDIIEIGGVGSNGIVTETLNGNVMTLSGAIAPTALTFATAPAGAILVPVLGPGGKSYEITAPCFAAGTRILTSEGPKPVEALRPGALVITLRGASAPVIWHGRRRIDCHRHPDPSVIWPVRIASGAFGPGLPAHDLLVSPDHALYLAGALIPAKHLINGVSVVQVPVPSVTYHHIELAAHDVIWAEGLPAETYLDCGNRHQFQGGKAISLHPDFAPIWDGARGYAPLVTSGRILAEARAALHARLLGQGFAPKIFEEITVNADGRSLPPAAQAGGRYRFAIPRGASTLTIFSLCGVAAETDPYSEDRRRLGIALTKITAGDVPAAAGDPRFGAGFYPAEDCGKAWSGKGFYPAKYCGKTGRGGTWFRWTDGAAAFDASGIATFEFTVKARQAVWRMPQPASPDVSAPVSSASHSRSPA